MVKFYPYTRWLIPAIPLIASAAYSAAVQQTSYTIVGKDTIGQTDLNYCVAIARVYGNQGITEATALVSLVNDALEREVGRRNGVNVTAEELAGFSMYVDESSKAPELLNKVKQVFGEDMDAYRRIYLAPKIMNRKLREWFSRDPGIQLKQRTAIEKANTLVQTGMSLEDAANKAELMYIKQHYQTGPKNALEALKTYYPEGMPAMSGAFMEVLNRLKKGQVAPTIIENEFSYRVVRLISKNDVGYKTEEVVATKRNFGPWFHEQTLKVQIMIRNSILLDKMCQENYRPRWLATHCR